jgi:hypothetical protein
MAAKVSLRYLKDETNQIRRTYPKLKDDSAFVLWFLRAFLSDSEDAALKALTGVSSDRNVDAILIDGRSHQVHLVQGKFRQSQQKAEKRNDVLAFADLSTYPWEGKKVLEAFYSKLDPLVREKFQELVRYVRSPHRFELRLYYVTTGHCSKSILEEAKAHVRQAEGAVEIRVMEGKEVLTLFKDYLEGVAPAVPALTLPVAAESAIQNEGAIHRFDPRKKIESWVFTMAASDVGEMYAKVGLRLFARNIRGYLGDTSINEAMTATIRNEPENFWYYNNGVTMVCDDVKREVQGGQDVLRVEKPQVINGQQTTRQLHDSSATKGSVLVKIIKIPRHPGDDEEYDNLVNSIVRATNWQNHIDPSDLVSNDFIQVFIERSLRKIKYQYIRKKQSKSEARRQFGNQGFIQIQKHELAQAVGGCEFDPAVVRRGKEGLFEDPYYKAIFSSHSVSYYLSRYWLMRQIQYVAHGRPERAYAKWLVLNFIWKEICKAVETGEGEKKFRAVCEEYYSYALSPLQRAISGTFRAALAFFRSARGKGEKAMDISTFFRLTKLDYRFADFWMSSKNSQRNNVNQGFKLFRERLNEVEFEA